MTEFSNAATNVRNSLLRGRTGTRLNIGRPQPRWQDGCDIARSVLSARSISLKGSNAWTVGTIIKESIDTARAFVSTGNASASHPRPT